jgi:hypothetical protein
MIVIPVRDKRGRAGPEGCFLYILPRQFVGLVRGHLNNCINASNRERRTDGPRPRCTLQTARLDAGIYKLVAPLMQVTSAPRLSTQAGEMRRRSSLS